MGLYVPEEGMEGIRRGVCRFFDVRTAPPKKGRPRVDTTLSLSEFTDRVVGDFRAREFGDIEYVDPEPDL